MMDNSIYFSVLVILICLENVLSITNSNFSGNHAKILWELSDLALQSQGRQNSLYPPSNSKLPNFAQFYNPNYQNNEYLQGEYIPNDISQNYPYPPQKYPYYPQKYLYNPQKYPYYPQKYPQNYLQKPTKESIMDVLFSIAQNDDLQCVPKLVCELTSGTMSGRQLGLPINVNPETLLGLLSTFNSAQSSPILHFGKAAFLGFASKGNSRSCGSAYPSCPSDSNKLLNYLNNHKGGFFKFFQDVAPQQENYAQNFDKYRPYYYNRNQPNAEKRIINHVPTGGLNNGLFFDGYDSLRFQSYPYPNFNKINFDNTYRESRIVVFPEENDVSPFRVSKKLRDSVTFHNIENNQLDIQKPLPNHVPNPMIFPDRTGTGELKLDYNDFLSTENNGYSNFPNK